MDLLGRAPWFRGDRWLLSALFFALALALFTRHNDFPVDYHPDEPGKAAQVIKADGSALEQAYLWGGERPEGESSFNFRHPQLMLSATRLAVALTGTPYEPQAVVEMGRFTSALLAALAVVALLQLAYLLEGPAAALAVGLTVTFSKSLLVYAHYLKEDATLAFGLAVFFLALAWFWKTRRPASQWALGVASGLALSGKYVGAVAPLLAIPFLLSPGVAEAGPRGRRALRAGIGLAVATTLCNLPMLSEFHVLLSGLGYEMNHATTGHSGAVHTFFQDFYLRAFAMQVVWPVAILAGAQALLVFAARPRGDAMAKLLVAFPVGYALFLQTSAIVSQRYLLPSVVVVQLLAGLGLVGLARRLPVARGPRIAFAAALAAVVTGVQAFYCADHLHQFAHDSRDRLALWIEENLPHDALIAGDWYAMVSRPYVRRPDGRRVPARTAHRFFLADVGSTEFLRRAGVTHMALAESSYGRFMKEDVEVVPAQAEVFARRRSFYRAILREENRENLVWDSVESSDRPRRPTGGPVNPRIRLYRVPAADEPGRETAAR